MEETPDLPWKAVDDVDPQAVAALAQAAGVPLQDDERAAVAATLAYFSAGAASLDAYLQEREEDDDGAWFPRW